nr:zinc finger MYM-type protein 1-like [Parasteatoda tepidariorum]
MKPVDEQVDSAASRRKLENRKNITPIIETILFCGNQGLALRGHKDSGIIAEQPGEENDGNFRALLRFRSKNDSTLKNILESSRKNAQYTSPRFQNEVIEVCNILILQKLVSKINDATCFSILADETTDIAGIEQLSLCVRYVDKENFNITEQFLQFIPVHDLTGKAIATTILDQLQSMKVDIKKLRGQGYDGAASMSGKINGVQAHVRSIVPSALYVHCSAHSLNLAVSNACEITGIRNCLGTIKTLYDFLNTPKRQYVLSSAIEEMETSSKREKIKQLCATRWMERYDSVTAVVELFEPIAETLQKISEWKDKESATQANSLLCTVSNCQFVISLLCIYKVFTITIHLCRYLQKTSIDLIEAVSLAEDVIKDLKLMRENATETFSEIFSSSSLMLTSIGSSTSMQIPRITGRQKNRDNFPSSTPETYFRCLLPADPFICQPSNIKAFEALVEFYAGDLDTCKESLKSELKLWYKRLKRISEDGGSVPKTAADALGMCNKDITPNIFKLLRNIGRSTCFNECKRKILFDFAPFEDLFTQLNGK